MHSQHFLALPEADRPPLLWEPISAHPLPVKLTAIRTALARGADPNELEQPSKQPVGRPLHFAISEKLCVEHAHLMENVPVIELLLEAGADPRLSAVGEEATEKRRSEFPGAVEEARRWLDWYEDDRKAGRLEQWGEKERGLKPFMEEAYAVMKKVADRLDAEDAARKKGELGEKGDGEKEGSMFAKFKFW